MHTLPQLPYAYSDLQPHIDAQTMEVHHTKHHQTYIDKLNAALEPYPDLQDKPVTDLLQDTSSLPQAHKTAIINHGGGHANHALFWTIISPQGGGQPSGDLAPAIDSTFGNFTNFQDQFSTAAANLFGSGWAWLVLDQGKLKVIDTPNQDSPLSQGLTPLLNLDVWEHAYYLKYQNRRADYIQAFWHVVNWDQVSRNLQEATT